MAVLLTDMFLKNLKPKDKEYTKREPGGLGVRVLCSGTKTLAYFYTIDGKRRFLNLGKYKDKSHPNGITLAEARNKLEIERGKVTALKEGRSDGSDPVLTKKLAKAKRVLDEQNTLESLTVSGLISDYIERHSKRFKKSWQADQRMLNKELLAKYGTLKASDFKKAHILRVLEEIIDRGSPSSANQCLKIVRKMCNWAVEKDLLEYSPCSTIKMPAPTKERKRYLTEDEIKVFWKNIEACPVSNHIKRALKLILVTAQRPGEVIGMHTEEISGRWWTFQSDRTKNNRPHRVYLTNLALKLIGNLEKINSETGETKPIGYVFPSPHRAKNCAISGHALSSAVSKRMLKVPLVDASGNKVCDKDGFPLTINKIGIKHFTPHDLRRTATTIMASNKIPFEHRERVLNHTQGKLDRTYNLFDYADEKKKALEVLEQAILKILNTTE